MRLEFSYFGGVTSYGPFFTGSLRYAFVGVFRTIGSLFILFVSWCSECSIHREHLFLQNMYSTTKAGIHVMEKVVFSWRQRHSFLLTNKVTSQHDYQSFTSQDWASYLVSSPLIPEL